MKLRHARTFVVGRSLLARGEELLRDAGERRSELFLFLSGPVYGGCFYGSTLHVPEQVCARTERGLSVSISSAALTRQSEWLVDHDELLGVQVHTHPDEAYHSDADERHAVVTQVGALSIVVPDFCRRGILDTSSAFFRLRDGGWMAVENDILQVADATR